MVSEIAAYAAQGPHPPGLQRWLALVHNFLIELGETPFTAFNMIGGLILEAGPQWQKFRISPYMLRQDSGCG
jgi:hypothetical protein